jgi:hypothetical protein
MARSSANASFEQNVGNLGLAGSDESDSGTPDATAVDDLEVSGCLNDPKVGRPSVGRSKLVGT